MKTVHFITSYAGELLHPDTFHQKCYGSEFALVEIARRLTNRYNVFVFNCTPPGYKKNFLGIEWRSHHDFEKCEKADYIVISRYINSFLHYNIPDTKIYVWLHDLVPHMLFLNKMLPISYMGCVIPRVTKWVPVGEAMISEKAFGGLSKYGITPDTCYPIKNGITLEEGWDPLTYKGKKRNSFIYSSWASKGLWNLLDRWGDILKIMPDAFLNVYYSHSEEETARFKTYKEKYPTSIVHHGRVEQNILYEAIKNTEYWVFPNDFPESCCTTSMEMQYYGVICITNNRGELKYNVAGCLIQREDNDNIFWDTVLDILKLCKDDEHLRNLLIKRQYLWAKMQTWDARADKWHTLFSST